MKHLILILSIMMAASSSLSAPREESAPIPGSVLADSISFPGEVFVITAGELREHRINSLEDILELLPGISWWRSGSTGAPTAFSVAGRRAGNPALLVNGRPYSDPWTGGSLGNVVPLSRLVQVEVIHSHSPSVTGIPGSGSVINLVIEEGGRKGPIAVADFSNGKGNRRARRFWFSTPESFINLTIAYDEYLQDASFPSVANPDSRIGQYDSRSVLTQLKLTTDDGDKLILHLQKFQDTFTGTEQIPLSPPRGGEVRYSGVDARLEYRKGSFSIEAGQRLVEVSLRDESTNGLVTGASLRWKGEVGGLDLLPYMRAERSSFENRIDSIYGNPEHDDLRFGITAFGVAGGGMTWRVGIHGGYHSEGGEWVGGEAGLSRGDEDSFYQSLILSRNLVVPAARSYFHPGTDGVDEDPVAAGVPDLEAGISDEISLGLGFVGRFSLDLFARRESKIIYESAEAIPSLLQDGKSNITGVRGRIDWKSSFAGLDYGCGISGEYFASRSDYTDGVPEYRIMGGLFLSRKSFKKTETITLRMDGVASGDRPWEDRVLDGYLTADLTFSITVMSAIIQVQYKNLFDSEYEIYPGFRQHERHIRYGFIWNILD